MNVVQSLWIIENGPRKISPLEILCMKSFIYFGYEFHLYVYDDGIEGIPDEVIIKDANEIISNEEIFTYSDGEISGFSNFFRYRLLFINGGYWTDMDMICQKKFDFVDDYVFSSEYIGKKKVINVGVIKVPKKSKLMLLCYKNCDALRKSKMCKWGELGPSLFSKFVNRLHLKKYVKDPEYFCPVTMSSFDDIFCSCTVTECYTIHLWNQIWTRRKLDKNNSYADGSLIEQLKRQFGVV
jgi:hypothetical protein